MNPSGIQKYLLYAIGEIILVMIGILLALQVNNWNEAQKNKSLDRDFLLNLRQELRIDTTVFRSKIQNYEDINKDLWEADSLMRVKSVIDDFDRDIIASALRRLEQFTPIQKLTSSGDTEDGQARLERIDPELNLTYKSYLENLRYESIVRGKLGESLQLLIINHVYPFVDLDYFRLDGQFEWLHFDYSEIRNNRNIRNAMNKSFAIRSNYILTMKEQLKMVQEMMTSVNQLLPKE